MLQGTLNDFSLPDVFSLLALTKKSGALRVTSEGTDGRVFFREGAVCLALSDAARVPLGARLVSAGLVEEDDLRAVMSEHGGSSVAVTDALLQSGKVEDRILSVYLREQIVDAVFELLRLDEGSFAFDAGAPGLTRGLNLPVVEVVNEAARRLDEWHAISRRIASPRAVLAMVPSAINGREGISLVPDQWDLLALIDGRRTVSEIVELTGKGEFATCRVLGDLVEIGLVEAQDPETGGKTRLDKLISAREALRALEHVDQPLNPRLSAAAPLGANGTAVRWIEPDRAEQADAPAAATAQHAPLSPRTRESEVALAVTPRSTESEVPLAVTPLPADQAPVAADLDRIAVAELEALVEPETADDPTPVEPDPAPEPVLAPRNAMDRAQVSRELASLGLDEDLPSARPTQEAAAGPRLTRDEDVNKGLLLRLIDGVKGA